MPVLDKPLSELNTYLGSSPCPGDIDAYWDNGLSELRRVEPAVSLTESEFSAPFAECSNLYFTGIGGSRIYAKYIKPLQVSSPHPALLFFHGYTGASPQWMMLLPWAAAGFSVFAMDCRGQGGKSEDTGTVSGTTYKGHIIRGLDDSAEKLLFRSVFLDTVQLARIAMEMPEVDPKRIGAYGGSQGGGLTIACAALEPRINRAVAEFPFLSDYKRVWDMDLCKRAYEELAYFFRSFDPLHAREDEIFNRLGYIDIQNIAGRIKAKILMGISLADDVCPPSTQFAVYNKIKSIKQNKIYPDFGHEMLPGFADETFTFMMNMNTETV